MLFNGFFLRGRDFRGQIVGLAYIGSMCYGSQSIGIVQDKSASIRSTGGTLAHELGHILGMKHDDSRSRESHYLFGCGFCKILLFFILNVYTASCTCNDRTGKCLMAGLTLTTPATTWSDCSRKDVIETFKVRPAAEMCLFNVPMMTNGTKISVVTQKNGQHKSYLLWACVVKVADSFIIPYDV